MTQVCFLDAINIQAFTIIDTGTPVLILGAFGETADIDVDLEDRYIDNIDQAHVFIYTRLNWEVYGSVDVDIQQSRLEPWILKPHQRVWLSPYTGKDLRMYTKFISRISLMPKFIPTLTFENGAWTEDEAEILRLIRMKLPRPVSTDMLRDFLMMYFNRRVKEEVYLTTRLVELLLDYVGTIVFWTPRSYNGRLVIQTF